MVWTGSEAVSTNVGAIAMGVAVTSCGTTTTTSSIASASTSFATSAAFSAAFSTTSRSSVTIGMEWVCRCSELGLHGCHLRRELSQVVGEGRAVESGCTGLLWSWRGGLGCLLGAIGVVLAGCYGGYR